MNDTIDKLTRLRAELASARSEADGVAQEAADLCTKYLNERDAARTELAAVIERERLTVETGFQIMAERDQARAELATERERVSRAEKEFQRYVREIDEKQERLDAALASEQERFAAEYTIVDKIVTERALEICQGQRDAALAALEKCIKAINWACGCDGDFEPPNPMNFTRYWWRKELAERSGMVFDRVSGAYALAAADAVLKGAGDE